MLDSAPVPKETFGFVTTSEASWKASPDPPNTQVQLRSVFMWTLTERYVITLQRWVDNWAVTGSDGALPRICLDVKELRFR